MYIKSVVMAVVLCLFVSNGHAQGQLSIQSVSYQQYPQTMLFDGVVEAVKQATISAQTSGRVIELNFDVDDFVAQGSVILRFRDEEQRAQLEAAKALVYEMEALKVKVEAEHKRVSELYEKKLISKSVLDQALADKKSIQQRKISAQAKQHQAEEQLAYTIVTAPFSGIVVARHIELGEVANVGQALISGFAVDDMRVSATVPQRYIEAVRKNQHAQIVFNNPQQPSLKSDEITFYPYADPSTHTFKVRVGLASGLKGVYPGMMVKVAFNVGTRRSLVVDASAVVYRSELRAVYVVDDQRISYRQVRLGNSLSNGQIEVLSGLHEHEQIALNPVQAGIQLKHNRLTGGK